MQQRQMDRYKEQLGCSDDEFAVIQPRLQKVLDAQTAARAGGMMGGRGGRGGRGGMGMMGGQGADAEPTPVQEAMTELQTTLEKEAPTTAEIQAKLTALRGAQEKAAQQLADAQKALKDVLTLKQEAQLCLMGILN